MEEHIGLKIRAKRRELKRSAEYVALKLKRPITKQAFLRKEKTGSFSFELVSEVASILECDMADFLPSKSTKSLQNKNDPNSAA